MLIEQTRFPDKFELVIDVPEELLDYLIFKVMIQPFVENAIKHGIEPVAADTTIYIKAWEDNGRFKIEITDSGKGMDEEDLAGCFR